MSKLEKRCLLCGLAFVPRFSAPDCAARPVPPNSCSVYERVVFLFAVYVALVLRTEEDSADICILVEPAGGQSHFLLSFLRFQRCLN